MGVGHRVLSCLLCSCQQLNGLVAGLLYWVGTQEGTEREWSNPCLTGDVNVTVSSKDGGAVNNALARVPSKLCTEDIDG